MNLGALLLVVVAACAHAGWNLVAKRVSGEGVPFVWLFQTLSLAIFVPVCVVVLAVNRTSPNCAWLAAGLVSAALHTLYSVTLLRGYAVGDLSVVYPVARGSGPLFSVLAAIALLGERPAPLQCVGATVVVLGVALIGLGRGEAVGSATTSVRWGLLIGLIVSAFTLWDAYSVHTIAVDPLALFCGRALSQSLILSPYAWRHREQVRSVWCRYRRETLLVSLLAPIASILVLYALRLAPVSIVAPARELSVVIATVIAWRWLNEPEPGRRLGGAGLVLAGIVVITVAG